jgi:hypothetical protein
MTPMLGIMASQISGHLSNTAYESIETVTVGSGGTASITFSSIAADWKHLQIRLLAQSNRATYGTDSIFGTFNSDTGSNYAYHVLRGDGANASATNGTSQSRFYVYSPSATSTASAYTFGAGVIDILDYANTNKYKTIRCLAGADLNGTVGGYGGAAALTSSLWQSTSAVTSINLAPESGTLWNQYSSFALYGIKG